MKRKKSCLEYTSPKRFRWGSVCGLSEFTQDKKYGREVINKEQNRR